MTGLQWAVLAITSIGLINCLVFCAGYQIKSKGGWRKSEHGVFMMLFIASLGTLFALIISTRLFGDWPGRMVVSTLLYTGYVAITFWPTRLLVLAFRDKRALPSERNNNESKLN